MSHFIAHILNLVASNDVVQVVVFAEFLGNIRTKLDAHASLRLTETHPLLRIGPQQLAHKTFLGRLAISFDASYMVQSHVFRGEEPAVHDQDLLVDAVAQRQPVENLREYVSHGAGVLRCHLASESIHLVHVNAFMVAWNMFEACYK